MHACAYAVLHVYIRVRIYIQHHFNYEEEEEILSEEYCKKCICVKSEFCVHRDDVREEMQIDVSNLRIQTKEDNILSLLAYTVEQFTKNNS